jgi:hypothetical protein
VRQLLEGHSIVRKEEGQNWILLAPRVVSKNETRWELASNLRELNL